MIIDSSAILAISKTVLLHLRRQANCFIDPNIALLENMPN